MEFGSNSGLGNNYFHAMDREYEAGAASHHDCGHDHGSKATGDLGVSVGDLGFSFALGPVSNVQQIAAKLRPGSKTVELVFTGRKKGSGQAQTPEYYGERQRQALREVAAANRVDFTTHSTVGVTGVAGLGQRGFSLEEKNQAVEEVKRAIEFAADVARGGPVVVHTGEIQRPIAASDWNQKGDFAGKFEMHEKEDENATFMIVDTRQGSIVDEAKKNMTVARPIWLMAKPGQKYLDQNGNLNTAKPGEEIYVDYFDHQVGRSERLPEYDNEKQNFKTIQYGWNDIVKESQRMTQEAKETWNRYKGGKLSPEELDSSLWRERIKLAHSEKDLFVSPEEAHAIARLETQAASALGQAVRYGSDFNETIKRINRFNKAKETVLAMEKTKSDAEKNQLREEFQQQFGDLGIHEERYLKSEFIEEQIKNLKSSLRYNQEASSSQRLQAEETLEKARYLRSAQGYAQQEAYDAYAQAGISAMRESDQLKEQGKLKKPIVVAMENLWPEQYGSHPDEMKELVIGSQKRMAEKLQQLGLSQEQAENRSKQHITATLDVGHLNVWRKYWKGDPKNTIKQNDEEFNKWAVQKVKELAESGVVGHVHLDDNYGYNDDHLAPGEGNAPIREMVKALKDGGYKGEMIVEPGADFTTDHPSGFSAVTKTWQHFDLPIYGRGLTSGGSRNWSNVTYGWRGAGQPPYFSFGGYVPSEDFTLWSGVPFE
ncbi:MAG: TIM barrel protein [archaeon]|nr:TIM barrel protein [archaeon]